MTAFGKKWLTGLVTGALMAVSAGSLAAEQKTLHVYNWSDYIARTLWPILIKRPGLKWCTTFLIPTKYWKAN
ncbi:Putrescine-binding periplasmic protein precursor [Raoultella terrigena]|uniref:Putrescine-binding periplasmic protein n=1 Tax=Raoultella terrigena TaxID=577 RepID=A0A3P8J2X4_RAOTE|nr:Putrescine-binding periplasmic protein precursor [Raoultella terrigena]